MDRQDFMDIVYAELASDPDNNRANRIIWAADGYAESAQLGTNLADVGTDSISRQTAIDGLNDVVHEHNITDFDAVATILALPSVMPKQRTGKWIDTGGNEEWYAREYRCSECGDIMLGEANFCPNCGAKMKGSAE